MISSCLFFYVQKGGYMDVGTIQTLISTLGFPIVCVLFLGWFIWKIWTKQQDQNEKREDKLYSVVADAQATNEKLVKTNAEFVEVLHSYKSDLDDIKNDVSEIKENMKG